MMLDVALEADAEWDSSTVTGAGWDQLAREAASAAIAESAFPFLLKSERAVELSVRLTSDADVQALNAHWRGKDRPTNVLSFPMTDPAHLDRQDEGPELLLGDIVLAHGVCVAEAQHKGIPLEAHVSHLLVHGTLHLVGYDHDDDRTAAEMEARETRALARLGIADPYAGER